VAGDNDVREVPAGERDEEVLEAWERTTADPAVGGVSATKVSPTGWTWQVSFGILEYVRDQPLLGEVVAAIVEELSAVEGVTKVAQDDTEVFVVRGAPAGEHLVEAAARAVDGLGDQLRAHYNSVVADSPRIDWPLDPAQLRLLRQARDAAGPTFLDGLGASEFRELTEEELREMEERYPVARRWRRRPGPQAD
jgi:hypothetical protein